MSATRFGLMLGVISYLPDDVRIRDVRWKTTKKCIQNLLDISGWVGTPLNIVTTNWRDEEREEIIRSVGSAIQPIFYCVSPERRGAAVSRNILLRTFYNSDHDYLLMCDDDAHIYPYYRLEDFFRLLSTRPSVCLEKRLFHICAHLANSAPFKEKNMKDPDFCRNWVFSVGGDHAGRCPQIFANFKKLFGSEIYQREYLYNDLHLGGEDGCFDLDLMSAGVMAYTLSAFIAGTTEITSSFWNETKSKQEMLKDSVWEEGQATLDYIKREFPRVKQITKYRLDFSAYRPKCPARILVPREVEYAPTEWDMPVKRVKRQPLGLLRR